MASAFDLAVQLGQQVLSSSLRTRCDVLARLNEFLGSAAVRTPAGTQLIKTALQLLVQTQYVYVDHASRMAVVRALELMLAADPTLVGRALARVASNQATQLAKASRVDGGGAASGFVWASLLLRHHADYATAGKDLRAHLESMAVILRAVVLSRHRALGIVRKALAAAMRMPGRAVLLLEQALQLPPGPDALVLVGVMLAFFQHARLEVPASARPALLTLVKDGCLAHKATFSAAELDAAQPVFAQLTHDDMQSQLLPAIQRSLKRAPERAFDLTSAMLLRCSLDPSRYVAALVPDVVPALTEDALAAPAAALLTSLAQRSSELDAHVCLLTALGEALTSKKASKPESRSTMLQVPSMHACKQAGKRSR
jgi:hypothetical protein